MLQVGQHRNIRGPWLLEIVVIRGRIQLAHITLHFFNSLKLDVYSRSQFVIRVLQRGGRIRCIIVVQVGKRMSEAVIILLVLLL